jgi:addiction module HigA family antidote
MSCPVNRVRPIHPGEVLREDFLIPLEMSANALALVLAVPPTLIHEIVKERRGITADTVEKLEKTSTGKHRPGVHHLALARNHQLVVKVHGGVAVAGNKPEFLP